MNEIIVEGLNEEDFILLNKIVETYKTSINDEISFDDLLNIRNKLSQVLSYLND